MASNAAAAMNYEPAQRIWKSDLSQLLVSKMRQYRSFTREAPVEAVEVDLGLRAGVRVRFTPGKLQDLPPRIESLVTSIKEFESLQPGWDSYGAFPLSDHAVHAAMALIIRAQETCTVPDRVVPLSSGGLGLRWKKHTAELEVDVDAAGTFEGLIEVGDDDAELPKGSSLEAALLLVTQFRRID